MEEFKSLSLGEIKNKVESTQNLFLVNYTSLMRSL